MIGKTPTRPRVLVVDAERSVSDRLAALFGEDGWQVSWAGDGRTALSALRGDPPDVVVLDPVLPDMDGLGVLRVIRRERPSVPVLCLSGRAGVEDRIAALAGGGDDHVAKPFSVEEVGLRLSGLVQRASSRRSRESARIVVGDLVVDLDAHEVTRGGTRISLTATEFALLAHMARNANTVLSKSHLLRTVWDSDFGRDLNVVEVYIGYLRRKVDEDRAPMIHTVRGVGYVLRRCSTASALRQPTAAAGSSR